MNNAQFRNLLDTPRPSTTHDAVSPISSAQVSKFGSRTRSSMLMTPRSLTSSKSNKNDEFSRQVNQQKRNLEAPIKKPRSNVSVPKGTKFGQGYQDRAALLRQEQTSELSISKDDKVERVKALEDMVKLQQIDQATFEKLRDEIGVGGEIGSTHLVKGLDWKLLQRVRRGEDVLTATSRSEEKDGEAPRKSKVDVDEELESVLEKEIQPLPKEERLHKGTTAPRSSAYVPDGQTSRDEILRKLKASRAAAAKDKNEHMPVGPSLGSKFRGIGTRSPPGKRKFVETVKGRQREVLLITKPDGTTKRKVRWIDIKDEPAGAVIVQPVKKPMGMEVPAEMAAKQKTIQEKERAEEDQDQDIFAGVGVDYNPLGIDVDESGGSSESDPAHESVTISGKAASQPAETTSVPRNYFLETECEGESMAPRSAPNMDPMILAALRSAAAPRRDQAARSTGDEPSAVSENNKAENEFLARLRKREREDAADLDLGFGESRFGDEEDDEGPIWNGDETRDEQKTARKRGAKKRKGNKNEVKDVMSVLERGGR